MHGGEIAVKQRLHEQLLAAEEKCEENACKDTWAQCEACDKWRKLPRNPAALPNLWHCNLNPNQAFASCEIAEEHWSDSGEDQEEELAPRKSKRLRKSKAPRCAKRTRGDPFLDRWDAIGPDTLKGLCRDLRRNNKDLALTTSPPPFRVGAMREYLRMYY